MTSPNAPVAVFAHPGHELRILHALGALKVSCLYLTDASGSTGVSRLPLTTDLLADAGLPGRILGAPEDELPRYGLVFAKARAAIEAMASGCAVILADYGKIGPLVTSANFDALRQENFGIAAITDPPDETALREAIARIDWDDAAKVSARIRAEAPFANTVADYLADYEAIRANGPADAYRIADEARAYLTAILPHLSERDHLAGRLYHETKTRLDRDRELAALIARAKSDPDAFNDLMERARWLDPSNPDLKG